MRTWLPLAALGLALSPLAVVHPVRISGRSMEPTLRSGDLRVGLGAWVAGPPRRGEVWMVDGPEGPSVKRVVGLPGETLDQVRGDLRVGGRTLDEPYLGVTEREDGGPWACGPGYLVAGDNRPQSRDGRAWGALPGSAFRSRVLGLQR